MKKKLLVTGGAGFIGSNFVKYIMKNKPEYEINVFDKLTYAGNKANLPKEFYDRLNDKYIFTKASVRDREKVRDSIVESDIVVHFACESHVSNSLAHADDFVNTNVFGTMVLCEEIAKYKVEKFILISSSEVYGTAESKPMTEEHLLKPASPYAGSKAGQDRMAFSYYYSYKDFPLVIVRPFNQYGPNQHTEKVIPHFITKLIQKKNIYIENQGLQTRDWLYVEDLCRAIDLIIDYKYNDIFGEVINIGTGKEYNIKYVAEKIAEILNKNPEKYFDYSKKRKGQVMSHISSMEKSKNILNWEPNINFEQGLKKTVEWYLNNES
jgi:dTDP-glucose 4,6-dehydratase